MINYRWLREHAEPVRWEAPLYSYGSRCYCWQIGTTQGINAAGRREPSIFYLVARTNTCREVTYPDTLRLTTLQQYSTLEELNRAKEKRIARHQNSSRVSPCFRSLLSEQPRLLQFGLESDTPPFDNKPVVIQPVCAGTWLLVWMEANTDYIQIYDCANQRFIDDGTIVNALTHFLHKYPHVFLVCQLTSWTKTIYDAFVHPTTMTNRRLSESLRDRLKFLQTELFALRRSQTIDLAPYQIAESPSEINDHRMLYQTCERFTYCIIRRSA